MIISQKIDKSWGYCQSQNHKKRLLTDEQYREKIEERINNLITKLENKEIKLSDLTNEDQKVIAELLKKED